MPADSGPSSSSSSSGAKPTSSSAKFREHAHGRQDREFTSEQKAAVERIRKCKTTAYYEILAVEKTASDSQLKKGYHKLSLATHPDKNGAPGADEAFKLVSKAFQVLSDPQKRKIFDQTGADPESRGVPSGDGGNHSYPMGAGSPFGRFAGGGGPMFEAEMSPDDLFNMFFGGMGGQMGGGLFADGRGAPFAAFGGPGIRVHQFGGGPRVRRRRPTQEATQEGEEPAGFTRIFWQLLPLILFFLLPLISSLFSSDADAGFNGPAFSTKHSPPYTYKRFTPNHQIPFFVNPKDLDSLSPRDAANFDKRAETNIIGTWNHACKLELKTREEAMQQAQGIIFTDYEALKRAKDMNLPHCRKLEDLRTKRRSNY